MGQNRVIAEALVIAAALFPGGLVVIAADRIAALDICSSRLVNNMAKHIAKPPRLRYLHQAPQSTQLLGTNSSSNPIFMSFPFSGAYQSPTLIQLIQ